MSADGLGQRWREILTDVRICFDRAHQLLPGDNDMDEELQCILGVVVRGHMLWRMRGPRCSFPVPPPGRVVGGGVCWGRELPACSPGSSWLLSQG